MPRPCSEDVRMRLIDEIEAGASRREAAEWLNVSPSSAVKWYQRWEATGSVAPKPMGGSLSPLEKRADWLLDLIEREPDLTLNEIVARMHKAGIPGSRTALHRFFERHEITVKKKPARVRTGPAGRSKGAAKLQARTADA